MQTKIIPYRCDGQSSCLHFLFLSCSETIPCPLLRSATCTWIMQVYVCLQPLSAAFPPHSLAIFRRWQMFIACRLLARLRIKQPVLSFPSRLSTRAPSASPSSLVKAHTSVYWQSHKRYRGQRRQKHLAPFHQHKELLCQEVAKEAAVWHLRYCLNGSPQERAQKDPEKQRSQGIEREDGWVKSRKTKALCVTKSW